MTNDEIKTIAYNLLVKAMNSNANTGDYDWCSFDSYAFGVLQFAEKLMHDETDADSDEVLKKYDEEVLG